MGGFDDVAVMGDWMPPIPSPRSLFSSIIGDDAGVRSIANSGSENKHGPLSPATEGQRASGNVDQSNPTQASIQSYEASNSNVLAEPKMGSRGCLTERMAARAGFNAPRLNTESIRPADLSKNSEVRSPYLTIPAGLSPTTLLDSPIFLTNSLVLPSPTTGKFSFAPSVNNLDSTLMTDPDKGKKNTSEYPSSFVFKPNVESGSIPHFNAANKFFPDVGVSVHSNTSILHQNVDPPNFQVFSKSQAENRGSNLSSEQTTSVGVAQNSPALGEPHDDDGDQKSSGDPNAGGGQAEDGYNWRKYGQKQVKGSEYPRSYYKCTHPNCPVKKKVERSHEGHTTDIIYKGSHNHLKPYRRSSLGSSNAPNVVQLEPEAGTGANGNQSWSNVQKGNIVGASDWGLGNLEAGSSAPLAQEHSSGATLQAQNGPQCESGDGVDGSSTFSDDEDDEDGVTHGSISLGYDGEGDESESKRRRIETYTSDMSGATRAIREPRVVVQTTSEVDILDDGYRWRKYGQKVVKGNPNPRSYYKCTTGGCNVRKHVERASHDLKSVITTYEGKHNHGVPAARNSSHINSGGSNALPTQQTPAAAVSSHIYGPETPQIRSSAAQFERPPLGSFGLPGRPQLGQGPGFGFGMSHPCLTGLGLGHHLGKFPAFPVHPYLAHQSRPMNGVGFMLPKAGPKLEPVTDSGMKSSSASSVYQQLMSQLPLEPQM